MSVRPRECTTRHFPVCLRPADGVTVTSGEVHDTEEERERVTRGPREGRAFSVASTAASPGLDGPRCWLRISLHSFPFSDFLSPLWPSREFFSWEIYLKIIFFFICNQKP